MDEDEDGDNPLVGNRSVDTVTLGTERRHFIILSFIKSYFGGIFFSGEHNMLWLIFFLMHIHEPHTTISCTSPRWILLRMKPDTSGVNTVLIWATFGSTADAPRPRPPCCRSAVHSSLLQTFIPDRTWWEVCLFQTNKEKVKSSTRTNELHHWIF